ncbi:MAG: hypothetical protein LBG62_04970 [Candidatus Methanoplasma sp.]|jgi:hypothetical protein|nr:hypothetical protein [Candidatus Methanoplasma sp.]
MGFGDSIKSGIGTVANKTSGAIDNAGISTKISGKKGEIEKIEKEIGAMIYGRFSAGEGFGDDVAKLCEDVKRIEAEIADLESKKK